MDTDARVSAHVPLDSSLRRRQFMKVEVYIHGLWNNVPQTFRAKYLTGCLGKISLRRFLHIRSAKASIQRGVAFRSHPLAPQSVDGQCLQRRADHALLGQTQ